MNLIEQEVKFGRYKGTKWEDLIYHDSHYVHWVINNAEHSSITDDLREELIDALKGSGYVHRPRK